MGLKKIIFVITLYILYSGVEAGFIKGKSCGDHFNVRVDQLNFTPGTAVWLEVVGSTFLVLGGGIVSPTTGPTLSSSNPDSGHCDMTPFKLFQVRTSTDNIARLKDPESNRLICSVINQELELQEATGYISCESDMTVAKAEIDELIRAPDYYSVSATLNEVPRSAILKALERQTSGTSWQIREKRRPQQHNTGVNLLESGDHDTITSLPDGSSESAADSVTNQYSSIIERNYLTPRPRLMNSEDSAPHENNNEENNFGKTNVEANSIDENMEENRQAPKPVLLSRNVTEANTLTSLLKFNRESTNSAQTTEISVRVGNQTSEDSFATIANLLGVNLTNTDFTSEVMAEYEDLNSDPIGVENLIRDDVVLGEVRNHYTPQRTSSEFFTERITISAKNATFPEEHATASEINTATSERNAAMSEIKATTSVFHTAVYETNAAISEEHARMSKKNVALPEKNAALSENYESLSETDANVFETDATTFGKIAMKSEKNAMKSEDNATTFEKNAPIFEKTLIYNDVTIIEKKSRMPKDDATMPESNDTIPEKNAVYPKDNATISKENVKFSENNAAISTEIVMTSREMVTFVSKIDEMLSENPLHMNSVEFSNFIYVPQNIPPTKPTATEDDTNLDHKKTIILEENGIQTVSVTTSNVEETVTYIYELDTLPSGKTSYMNLILPNSIDHLALETPITNVLGHVPSLSTSATTMPSSVLRLGTPTTASQRPSTTLYSYGEKSHGFWAGLLSGANTFFNVLKEHNIQKPISSVSLVSSAENVASSSFYDLSVAYGTPIIPSAMAATTELQTDLPATEILKAVSISASSVLPPSLAGEPVLSLTPPQKNNTLNKYSLKLTTKKSDIQEPSKGLSPKNEVMHNRALKLISSKPNVSLNSDSKASDLTFSASTAKHFSSNITKSDTSVITTSISTRFLDSTTETIISVSVMTMANPVFSSVSNKPRTKSKDNLETFEEAKIHDSNPINNQHQNQDFTPSGKYRTSTWLLLVGGAIAIQVQIVLGLFIIWCCLRKRFQRDTDVESPTIYDGFSKVVNFRNSGKLEESERISISERNRNEGDSLSEATSNIPKCLTSSL